MRIRVSLISTICLILLVASGAALAAPGDGPKPGDAAAEVPPADPGAAAAPATPARPPSADSPADKAKAKELFVEASKQFKAGRFDEAISIFEKAYALWRNPKILVNIAICHQERGRPRKAVEMMRMALAKSDPARRQELRDLAPETLRKADANIAELRIQMPEESEVEVGGTPEGKTPVTLLLMPGTYEVVIKAGGVEKLKKTVTLTTGAKEEWVLTTWPAAGPETPPDVGPKPKGSGFLARMQKLQTLPIWYFGAAAALAVVGGATLLGTGLKTNQLEDDFWANPTHATRDEGVAYRAATNAMVGITVTALVGAAVLALFTDWKNPFKKKERQVQVVPQVGEGGAGVVVSGGF